MIRTRATAVAGCFVAVVNFAPTPAPADDAAAAAQLLRTYDARLLENLRRYDGTPGDLLNRDRIEIARETALDVFGDNWAALVRYGDDKLARLPRRPAALYAGAPDYEKFGNGEMAVGLRVAGIGMRAALKLWDPEVAVDSFAAMVLGGFLDAEGLALNSIVTSMTSRDTFTTEWRGHPAIGGDRGFWTVILAYERDSQGSFLPLAVGVYAR